MLLDLLEFWALFICYHKVHDLRLTPEAHSLQTGVHCFVSWGQDRGMLCPKCHFQSSHLKVPVLLCSAAVPDDIGFYVFPSHNSSIRHRTIHPFPVPPDKTSAIIYHHDMHACIYPAVINFDFCLW